MKNHSLQSILSFLTCIFLVSLFLVSCNNQKKNSPEEITKHEIYRYKYTIEELQREFSQPMIKNAFNEMQALEEVNRKGIYQGTFSSINKHKTPEWYKDAKLGIFYDWGPYSIAGYGEKGWNRARYPDWYLSHMYHDLSGYHEKTWGKDFQRDDFIPLFTAQHFDAKEIINLVQLSGARYIVPFNKHHDGYCLWDSRYTHRDVVDMYPGRDLTAEIVKEANNAGIYHGFYFSVEDYEYPLIDHNNELYVRYWSKNTVPNNSQAQVNDEEITTEFISDIHNRMISGKVPVNNFINEYLLPQAKEFIDKYDPDILWFDGEWDRPAAYYRTPEIVAYFYNQSEGRKQVAANDRLGFNTR